MAQVGSKNLFEILGEDGEPKAAAPKQQPAKKTATTSKTIVGLNSGKSILKAGSAPSKKEGAFREAPVHVEKKEKTFTRQPKRGNARDFDRRSGSNKVDTEKKEVAGKGSWGDQITSEIEAVTDEVPATPVEETAEEVPQEPEETFKTLQDFLREKEESASKNKSTKSRKPNEGVDVSKLKDAVEFKKSEDILFSDLKADKKTSSKKKETKDKQFLDFEPKSFTEIQKEKEERRNSKGSRGGRPTRGGNKGPRDARPNAPRGGRPARGGRVNVSDTKAFPTLGGQ